MDWVPQTRGRRHTPARLKDGCTRCLAIAIPIAIPIATTITIAITATVFTRLKWCGEVARCRAVLLQPGLQQR